MARRPGRAPRRYRNGRDEGQLERASVEFKPARRLPFAGTACRASRFDG
jgi:hypothetical protein